MWKKGAVPGLMSDAINAGLTSTGEAPVTPITEDALTFKCLRCGRMLSAAQTVVTRSPTEVVYECPHDAARLVTIHDRDYSFQDGDLRIRVGNEEVDWWDYNTRGRR
jgi:hypothetical protein